MEYFDPPIVENVRRQDTDAALVGDGKTTTPHVDDEGRLKVSTKTAALSSVIGTTSAVAATIPVDVRRASNVVFHCKGGATTAAGFNSVFEASLDSTNGTDGTWWGIQVVRSNANTIELTTGVIGLATGVGNAYSWEASVNAYSWVRVRVTARTSGDLAWVIQRGSYATEPIPAIQTHAVTGSGTFTTSGAVTALPTGTAYSLVTTASTNAAVVKSSAGNLFELTLSNPTATAAYVKLYNKATAPTVGTDVPVLTIPVAGGVVASVELGAIGKRFATGIGIAVTAAAAATDTANAVAGVQVHGTYI